MFNIYSYNSVKARVKGNYEDLNHNLGAPTLIKSGYKTEDIYNIYIFEHGFNAALWLCDNIPKDMKEAAEELIMLGADPKKSGIELFLNDKSDSRFKKLKDNLLEAFSSYMRDTSSMFHLRRYASSLSEEVAIAKKYVNFMHLLFDIGNSVILLNRVKAEQKLCEDNKKGLISVI